jgi:uncharacterized membrane protein HdeD (DUF308 family)
MSDTPSTAVHVDPTILQAIRHKSGWFIALGIGLIILGMIALGSSVVATLVSVLFIGWLLVIGGMMQTVHAFGVGQWSGFFLRLFAGLLTLVVGILVISNPAAGAVSLTLLLAAFFMVGGLFRITAALTHPLPGRGWILLSGAVTLLLGIFIWAEWPVSGLWVIGTFVGIDMLFDGWSLVTLGLAVRRHPG